MPADAITASVHIDAPPERVYAYFTRPEAIVSWMGEHAVLEAHYLTRLGIAGAGGDPGPDPGMPPAGGD